MNESRQGWATTLLSNIVTQSLGGDWGKESKDSVDGYDRVSVVRGTEFKHWSSHRAAGAAQRFIKTSSLASRRLVEGDIVIEISGGGPTQPVGRTVLIDRAALDSNPLPLVCSNFFRQVRLHELIHPAYVNHFLNYSYSKRSFDEFQTQTTNLRNLNFTRFLNHVTVDLAPLNEQHRIVAKLENLLSRVHAARERLARIPLVLKGFRQSVLSSASTGALISDCKEQHSACNTVTLDQVSTDLVTGPFGSALHKSDYVFDGIPVVNPTNIVNGRIVPSRSMSISASTRNRLNRYMLKDADIVVARRGDLGRCALVTEREVGWLCGTGSAILRPDKSIVFPEYIQIVISSPAGRSYLNKGAVGSTMANLNQKVFLGMPILLPSLVEQREIVRRVNVLFQNAEEIEARCVRATAQVDKLTQSILAKAFRGELVPQDPNDEPASIFLERIRQQRNGAGATKVPSNKKGRGR